MSDGHPSFTVPPDVLRARPSRLRRLPWTVLALLIVSVVVQIVVNGLVDQRHWLDALAIGTLVAIPIAAAAGAATVRRCSGRDADALARQVRSRGGIVVTRAEARLLMRHALDISTHWTGRDVREPAPEHDVPLATEVGTVLRLSSPRPGTYEMTVLGPRADG